MAAPVRLIGEVARSAIGLALAERDRRLVIVLGMPGSGASLCARVLSALGVGMLEPAASLGSGAATRPRLARNGATEPGECSEIAALHARILDLFPGSRAEPRDDFALPVGWRGDPRVVEIRREIAAFVGQRAGPAPVGFREPDTVRLLPMWRQIGRELNLTPKIVYCLRNPAEVAHLRQARDGISLGSGEYRWFAYTLEVFRETQKSEICTIEYDAWFDDYRANLRQLQDFLELREDRPGFEADAAIAALVEAERPERHPGSGQVGQPLIRSVYQLARRADGDPTARERLQTIARQFLGFQQLQAAARGAGAAAAAGRETARVGAPGLRSCIAAASFWQPEHVLPSAWHQHAPFAFWITAALRPGIFVELGTHHGFSYLVFCQAVQRLAAGTKCYAVDTWQGDSHAGFYGEEVFARLNDIHERQYSGFSRLVRSSFDEALPHFGAGTIDLLHIDGRHGYADVAHDFAAWLPKLSERGVVLLHDINVRERGFGVWQFWQELQGQYRCFEFVHGHGLGVVQVGGSVCEALRPLFDASPGDRLAIAEMYAQLGRLALAPHELREQEARLAALNGQAQDSARRAAETLAELERQKAVSADLIEQRDALALSAEAMRAEIARLSEALAAAQVREEELERIRSQVAALREAVMHAEREARERGALEAMMRADMANAVQAARGRSEQVEMLKSELASAREVGRAMLHALAASRLATGYCEPRLGWRHSLRRLFGFVGHP